MFRCIYILVIVIHLEMHFKEEFFFSSGSVHGTVLGLMLVLLLGPVYKIPTEIQIKHLTEKAKCAN